DAQCSPRACFVSSLDQPMPQLFAQNHNQICDIHANAYPSWTDERIFQKARLINAAISAKIHTIEWTPAMLAEKVLTAGMFTNWYGSALLQVPALVGNPPPPVSLPRYAFLKFVSIYRMHPLLPEYIPVQPIGARNPQTKIPLAKTTFGYSGNVRNQLYNDFRRILSLPPKKSISEISSHPAVVAALNIIYQGNVEDVDLLIGSLAEDDRPDGFAFSETTFRLFILVASRRLFGDRFLAQEFKLEIYTPEGLSIIENANMSSILSSHFPELSESLRFVANPFLVWDNVTIQQNWINLVKSIRDDLGLGEMQFPHHVDGNRELRKRSGGSRDGYKRK
ncbi:hypothetical protein HDU76_006753, partial [Blyttiomyces sp. JEL0837]